MLKEYEITYWAQASLDEEKRAKLNDEIDSAVAQIEAKLESSNTGSRQRLSYPINKESNGFLRVIQVAADSEKIGELQANLRKMAGLIRFSIIQTPIREGLKMEQLTANLKETAAKKEEAKNEAGEEEQAQDKKADMTEEELESKIEEALDEKIK